MKTLYGPMTMPPPGKAAPDAEDAHARRQTALLKLRESTAAVKGAQTVKKHLLEVYEALTHCMAAFAHCLQCRVSELPGSLSKALKRLVRCAAFEIFFGIFIIANTVLIGVETEYEVHNSEDNAVIHALQVMFGIVFSFELVLRIAGEGKQFLL